MAAAAASEGRNGRTTADELRDYVERISRLEDQKAEIATIIAEAKDEAAGRGFDKKGLTQMVREFRMDLSKRAKQRAHEALCEVYRASLGMLDGTSLGEAARKRLMEEPEDEPEDQAAEGESEVAAEPPAGGMTQDELDAARRAGMEAADTGEKIYANPYVAGDPRRAAWDEGWCQRSGSDGMDIPKAWRRAEKPKKPPEDDANPPPPEPPEA